jgi:hypothetical protein
MGARRPEASRRHLAFDVEAGGLAWGRARAGLLAELGCEQLSAAQHRTLLCHLADECLDREPLRQLLAHRLDSAEGVKKHLREGLASDRVKLKARGALWGSLPLLVLAPSAAPPCLRSAQRAWGLSPSQSDEHSSIRLMRRRSGEPALWLCMTDRMREPDPIISTICWRLNRR